MDSTGLERWVETRRYRLCVSSRLSLKLLSRAAMDESGLEGLVIYPPFLHANKDKHVRLWPGRAACTPLRLWFSFPSACRRTDKKGCKASTARKSGVKDRADCEEIVSLKCVILNKVASDLGRGFNTSDQLRL